MAIPPSVALAGSPDWADRAVAHLRAGGFDLLYCADPAQFIDQLIDHCPTLLLVDGGDPNWRFWTTTPKTEQATRRLPVLAVVQHPAQEPETLAAGATACLLRDDLETALLDAVRAYGRLPDPGVVAQLVCQCQEALPPLAQLGVERFNAGAYYAQHDAFEEQWMAEKGPVRELYRAILQVGVAYYHITRGNHAGGLKMLRRSVQWFALLPDTCQGIDVRQFGKDAGRVRAVLQTMDPAAIDAFDRTLLKPIPRAGGT